MKTMKVLLGCLVCLAGGPCCPKGLVVLGLIVFGGCTSMERQQELMLKEVVRPVVEKVSTDTVVQAAQLTGDAKAINPKLVTEVDAVFGPGAHMKLTIGCEGVSGGVNFATQNTATQPATRE